MSYYRDYMFFSDLLSRNFFLMYRDNYLLSIVFLLVDSFNIMMKFEFMESGFDSYDNLSM